VIETATVTRYVAPLREGGSLPGIVEADDLGTYVCKFRGAGQGLRVLVAETIVSGLATHLGMRTPRLVALELADEIARYEADEEVQDLLRASVGLNLGVDFLPGAFTANVDRSWRNPNLLVWHGDLWLIDHGASLYFHHAWSGGVGDPARFAAQPWRADDHVLLDQVSRSDLVAADTVGRDLLRPQVLVDVLAEVPDGWLEPVPGAETPDAVRSAYVDFLVTRRDSDAWLPELPEVAA
jgi:hypothetical protein